MIKDSIKWLVNLTKSEKKPRSIAMAFRRKLGNMDDQDTKLILSTLAALCWAIKANGPQDRDYILYNEGKRDVFFTILDFIGLKDTDFVALNNLVTKTLEGDTDDRIV